MMHRLHTSVAALTLLTVAACSAPAQVPDDAAVVAALIVKPKIATSEPSAVLEPMRATLGQTAGVRYVRPMAGDAHIVHLTAPAQRNDVAQLVERLRASGAFQYVEVDSMLKIQ
jgi:cell division septation protein DedD